MATRDGFVEVSTEEAERYEGSAEQVVIDGPTPPRMRRQVLARDGRRCGNPRCHHQADHCHHVAFRSRGGKTKLANEVAVCSTCHALVHAGLLRVSGCAHDELCWRPVAAEESLARDVDSERAVADRLPVLQFTAESVGEESAIADSAVVADHGLDLDDLTHGLTRLGVPAKTSRRLIHAAIESVPPAEATEAGVLRRALATL